MNRREFLKNSALLTCCTFSNLSAKDIYLDLNERLIFDNTLDKLNKISKFVGFANFNIISFDEVFKIAKNTNIGKFSKYEIAILEKLFYENNSKYGFYGARTCENLTDTIAKKDVIKIPKTGHFLFRGDPEKIYKQLIKDVDDKIFLTSGVRGVAKQMQLFMNKIKKSDYNITLASFSIAPPACSYHSVGDFDIGKIGFGNLNFTDKFANTEEFKKLIKLRYINIRYKKNNLDGVRFEPWHIKTI